MLLVLAVVAAAAVTAEATITKVRGDPYAKAGLDPSKTLEAAIASGIFPESSERCVVCDWQCYLDRHPDLGKALGKTNVAAAQSHYWSDGKKEGRPCTCKDANSTLIELSGGNDNSAKNLKRCVGECDADSQCAAGHRCFQRSGFESVPGCKGNGKSSWDYCYEPSKGAWSLTNVNMVIVPCDWGPWPLT